MIDAEAVVVDIKQNCYICKLPNGSKILVAKTHRFTVNIGDVVTFAGIASTKLLSTHVHNIKCVRHDLSWQDVVNQYIQS